MTGGDVDPQTPSSDELLSTVLHLEELYFHPCEWRGNERLVFGNIDLRKENGMEILIFE
jgi:hypothetical protein